ncbi:50S ribosomal protein L10 [Candidatus Shikimatogenerans bostrichidophilus]|uniref:50S ribosomal protein L10 n=1 Tax=Candidatus Shikimatogenerans bostrichidophilus TaxID=2943807 RepID=UPI00296701E8
MINKKFKKKILNYLNILFNKYKNFYIIDISNFNSNKLFILKKDCYKFNIKLLKLKNTLFKKYLIINKKKYIFNKLSSLLINNNSIMFSNNAKNIANVIKNNKKLNNNYPILKVAYIDEYDIFYYGDKYVDILCNLKSKNELINYIIFILINKIKNFIKFIIQYNKINILNINKILFNKLNIN